jgi:hypothetical protein
VALALSVTLAFLLGLFFGALAEKLRRYLDDETSSPVSGDVARQGMRVVFAAEESSRLGREVAI